MKKIEYVPILKGKRGELSALQNISPSAKSAMVPLIEVIPHSALNRAASANPATRTRRVMPPEERFVAGLAEKWGASDAVFIDGIHLDGTPASIDYFRHVLSNATATG
ncbi:MAG: hypothetical protein ABI778_00005, partial [Ignavibacteriota bacterium]